MAEWKEIKSGGEVVNLVVAGSIEGTLRNIRETQYGYAYDIETEEGMRTLFGKTILDDRMATVPLNDKVRITRKEDVKCKNGRMAENYKVEVYC